MAQQLPIEFWTLILQTLNSAPRPSPPPVNPGRFAIGMAAVMTLVAAECDRLIARNRGQYEEEQTAQEILDLWAAWQGVEYGFVEVIESQEGQQPAQAPQMRPRRRRKRKEANRKRFRVWGCTRARKGKR